MRNEPRGGQRRGKVFAGAVSSIAAAFTFLYRHAVLGIALSGHIEPATSVVAKISREDMGLRGPADKGGVMRETEAGHGVWLYKLSELGGASACQLVALPSLLVTTAEAPSH